MPNQEQSLSELQSINSKLQERLTQSQEQTDLASASLSKVLEQRRELQDDLINLESMASLGTMMASLIHEISTPAGVAITASSFLREREHQSRKKMQDGTLNKTELERYFQDCHASSEIINRNLARLHELIGSFKQLSMDQHNQKIRRVNLCQYVHEVLLSLKPKLKLTKHKFCVDIPTDLSLHTIPGAIGQLLINLIMNSVEHAFSQDSTGLVNIKAEFLTHASGEISLHLQYWDNGKGMDRETIDKMYKPFFTKAKIGRGNGLGMHICQTIVKKTLDGTIECESELGKGTRFDITLPIEDM